MTTRTLFEGGCVWWCGSVGVGVVLLVWWCGSVGVGLVLFVWWCWCRDAGKVMVMTMMMNIMTQIIEEMEADMKESCKAHRDE